MSAIVKEIIIEATPERVFKALTQQNEIARWWTDDLSVKPEVGSLAEFRFYQGRSVFQFEIAELDAGKKVHWIHKQGPVPHWAGTSVIWQLTPVQKGTKLLFTHDGFAQSDEAYASTRENWEYFLESLKSYLETGKGTPGQPSSK